MARKNYTDALQATIDRVKRGGDQPPWWGFATVVAGVVFFLLFAWQVMSSGGQPPADSGTGFPGVAATTITSPASTPDRQTAGPTAQTSHSGTVRVPSTVSGATLTVPRAAVSVAQQALRGLYNVDLAQRVPTADGQRFPAPAATTTGVKFGTLKAQTASSTSVTFVAAVSPDGKGPSGEVIQPITVVLADGSWGFTNS